MKLKKKLKLDSKIGIVFLLASLIGVGTILIRPVFATTGVLYISVNKDLQNKTFFSASEGRILYSSDGKFGYLDYKGNDVIPSQYMVAEDFNSGIAKVGTDKGLFFIDEFGEVVFTKSDIAKQLGMEAFNFSISSFINGFASVYNDENIGYINTKGEFVIPFGKYVTGSSFGSGLLEVKDDKSEYHFIKSDGSNVFDFTEDMFKRFSCDRVIFKDLSSGKYGYCNELGQILVPATLDRAYDYKFDLAVYEKERRYGLLDKSGKVIFDPIYKGMEITDDGYIILNDGLFIRILNTQMQLIDKFPNGVYRLRFYENVYLEEDISSQYYIVKDFEGNLLASYSECDYLGDHLFQINNSGKILNTSDLTALPKNKAVYNENIGYDFMILDQKGEVVLELSDYDYVMPFSEGRAKVEKDGKYGYIDKNGAVVIPIQYDKAEDFKSGYASVCIGDEKYSIDLQGHKLIDPRISENYQIFSGDSKKKGIENIRTKKVVLKPEYSNVEAVGNDLFLLRANGLYGYYDAKNNKLLEPRFEYVKINPLTGIIIGTSENGKVGLYNLDDENILAPQYNYIALLESRLYVVSDINNSEGLVDEEGQIIIKMEYDEIDPWIVEDNLLVVGLRKGDAYSTLIYDLNKNKAISNAIEGDLYRVADSGIIVQSDDSKMKIIGFDGQTKYETSDQIKTWQGDYYLLEDNNSKDYIVDKSGEIYLKDNAFDSLYLPVFSESILFNKSGKFGIVSLEGKIKTDTLYNCVGYISDGIMMVIEGNQFMYVDTNGKRIVEMGEYDLLFDFQDGLGLGVKEKQ